MGTINKKLIQQMNEHYGTEYIKVEERKFSNLRHCEARLRRWHRGPDLLQRDVLVL